MPRKKYLSSYAKLATSNGYPDPLTYLFGRLKSHIVKKDHKAAQALALELIPYGHAKKAREDKDGETVKEQLIIKLSR